MYALIKDQKVAKFPYSLAELKKDNPSVSFPDALSDEELSSWGVATVLPVEPVFDSITENAQRLAPSYDVASGKWIDQWEILPASPDEIEQRQRANADYAKFYDLLLTSGVYQKIRLQATQDLVVTVACTEFVAAISDAKFGRPNEMAMQACISNILSSVTLESLDIQELAALLEQAKLAALYTLV